MFDKKCIQNTNKSLIVYENNNCEWNFNMRWINDSVKLTSDLCIGITGYGDLSFTCLFKCLMTLYN